MIQAVSAVRDAALLEERGNAMKRKRRYAGWKRAVGLLLAAVLTMQPAVGAAADIGLTAGNTQEENEEIISRLSELTGGEYTPEDVTAALADMGLLDEVGELNLSQNVMIDGTPMTLDEVKTMLAQPDADLSREVSVDGTHLTLGTIQTMLEIEDEIARIQKEYFSDDVEITEEHEKTWNSLVQQTAAEGLSIENTGAQSSAEGDFRHDARIRVTVDETEFQADKGGTAKLSFELVDGEGNHLETGYEVSAQWRTLSGSAIGGVHFKEAQGTVTLNQENGFAAQESVEILPVAESDVKAADRGELRWNGAKSFLIQVSDPVNALIGDGTRHQDFQINISSGYTWPEFDQSTHRAQIDKLELSRVGKDQRGKAESEKEFKISDDQMRLIDQGLVQNLVIDGGAGGTNERYGFKQEIGGDWSTTEVRNTADIDFSFTGKSGVFEGVSGSSAPQWTRALNELQDIVNSKNLGKIAVSAAGDTPKEPPNEIFNTYSVNIWVSASLEDDEAPKVVSVSAPAGTYKNGQIIPISVKFSEPVNMSGMSLEVFREGGNITLPPADTGISDTALFRLTVEDNPSQELKVYAVSGAKDLAGNEQEAYVKDDDLQAVEGVAMEQEKLEAFQSLTLEAPDSEDGLCAPDGTIRAVLEIDKDKSLWLENGDEISEESDGIYLAKTYIKAGDHTYRLKMDPETTGEAEGSRYIAEIPAKDFAQTQQTTVRAELYTGGTWQEVRQEGTTIVPAGFTGGERVIGVYGECGVAPLVLITGLTLKESTYPENGVIYKTSQKPVRLSVDQISLNDPAAAQATYPEIKWVSGNTDVAVINPDTGVVTAKASGTVAFMAVAENGGFSELVQVQTPEFTVMDGGTPAIVFQEGNDTFSTKQGQEVSVMWSENITDYNNKKEPPADTVFHVAVYEGGEAAGEAVYETDVTNQNEAVIPGEALTKLSVNSAPAYTVLVSAADPQGSGETAPSVSGRGYITVYPQPADIAFEPLESYYILDTAGSQEISWKLSEYQAEGGTFAVEIAKNGEPFHTISDPGQASYTLNLPEVPQGTLKDVYTVQAKAKNGSDASYSTDSFILHVYDADAMKILVDGEEAESVTLDNEPLIREIMETEGSAGVLALKRQIELSKMVSINSGDYPWGSITDRIQWDDGADAVGTQIASLNYLQGVYTDLRKLENESYRPSEELMLAGQESGTTTVTAVHAATGQKKTLDVTVNTLKDKLYLFQFYPKTVTTLEYVTGNGEARSVVSDETGALAIYEPDGIAGDISLKSTAGDVTYLGTLYQSKLRSSEGNSADRELYPLNSFELRPVSKLSLYYKDGDGKPYTGELIYRGAVYKNGQLCPDTLVGDRESGAEPERIQLGEDGRFTLEFDETRFWTEEEGEGNGSVDSRDRLQFVYEVTFPDDAYYPYLLEADGTLNADDMVNFGENIVTVKPVEEQEKYKPFISTYDIDYHLESGRLLSVTDYTGKVGASDQYEEPELRTTALLWGEPLDSTDYQIQIKDEDGKMLKVQDNLTTVYPFSTMAAVRNRSDLSAESTGLETAQSKKAGALLLNPDGSLVCRADTPFQLVNMVGATPLTESERVEQKLQELKDAGALTENNMPNFGETGGFLEGTMSFLAGQDGGSLMDNKYCRLKVSATEDPTVYKGLILLDANFIGEINRPMIDFPEDADHRVNYTPAVLDTLKFVKNPVQYGKNQWQDVKDILERKGKSDVGGEVGGYFECEIRYDEEKKDWMCVTTGGGFTVAANMDYAWNFNLIGGLPITFEFGLGGVVMLDYKNTTPVEEELVPAGTDMDDAYDMLTTLRLWLYVRAFAGIGFDISLLAFKLGIYGQIDVDTYTYFLTRYYLNTEEGAARAKAEGLDIMNDTTLHGEVGIKLLVKFLFFSQEHTFISTDDLDLGGSTTGSGATWQWKSGDVETVENWMKKSDFPNAIPGFTETEDPGGIEVRALSTNGGLTEVASGSGMESREYLEKYERVWAGGGTAPMSGEHTPSVIQSNSYPYANPSATRDGAVAVYLSDGDSTNLNETRASYMLWNGSGYEPAGEIPAPEGKPCESCGRPAEQCICCDYCGRLKLHPEEEGYEEQLAQDNICGCVCPQCGNHPDDCACEVKLCGFCQKPRRTQAELDALTAGKTEEEAAAILAENCSCTCSEGHLLAECTCDPNARADSNLKLDGTGAFAVAAWEQQSYQLPKSQSEADTAELNAMTNGTEIVASIYSNGSWNTVRLTDNKTPDVAPVVAAANGKAVVAWRATAGSDPAGQSYADISDTIQYRVYDSASGNWSEPAEIYNGRSGSVNALQAAMMDDGTAALVYTLDTGGENGSGLEIVTAIIGSDGRAELPLRLTNDQALDNNPQITVVNKDDKQEFVIGWYHAGNGEGTDTPEIRLAALFGDGTYDRSFPDTVAMAEDADGYEISGDFRFAKGENLTLDNLSVVWKERKLTVGGDEGALTQADTLQAVRFCRTAEGGYILSSAQEIAEMSGNTIIDSFDAYASDGNRITALLQASEYAGDLVQEAEAVFTVEPIAHMQMAQAALTNTAEITDVSVEYENLKSLRDMQIGFKAANRGISPIVSFEIRVGESTETIDLAQQPLLPGQARQIFMTYQVPETIRDEEYTVTATYGDGSQDVQTGSLNLDMPDVQTASLEMGEWGEGKRSMTGTYQNISDVKLAGDAGRRVYVGFYSNENCEEDSLVPVTLQETGEQITKLELSEQQKALLDEKALTLKVVYDIQGDLEDGLFPESGIQLYTKIWVEEEITDGSGEYGVTTEYNTSNNSKSIRFGDPVEENGGRTHSVGVRQRNEAGKTTAQITVKNLSMQPSQNGNLLVTLVGSDGKVKETKLYASDSTQLIALGGEQELTFDVEFSQEGAQVKAEYFEAVQDDWNNRLAALSIEGVSFDTKFDPQTAEYTASSRNLTGAVIQAAAASPEAEVAILDGTGTKVYASQKAGASAEVPLEYGDTEANTFLIRVTPKEPQAAPMVYTVRVKNERDDAGTVVLGTDAQTIEGWTNAEQVTVSISGSGFEEGYVPASWQYRINGGAWQEGIDEANAGDKDAEQAGSKEAENTAAENTAAESTAEDAGDDTAQSRSVSRTLAVLTEEGEYLIDGRLTGQDGYQKQAPSMDIKIDRTAPEIAEEELKFIETTTPLKRSGLDAAAANFKSLFGDGNTEYQLRVEVPVTDTASGVKKVELQAGDQTYPMEKAVNDDGQEIWRGTVEKAYRGALTVRAADLAGNESTYATEEVVISDSLSTDLSGELEVTTDKAVLRGSFGVKNPDDLKEYGVQYREAGTEEWREMEPGYDTKPNAFTYTAEELKTGTAYEYRYYMRLVTQNETVYLEPVSFRTCAVIEQPRMADGSCGKCRVKADREMAAAGEKVTYTIISCKEHTPESIVIGGQTYAVEGDSNARTFQYTVQDTDRRVSVEARVRDKKVWGLAEDVPAVTMLHTDERNQSEEALRTYLNGLKDVSIYYDNGTQAVIRADWTLEEGEWSAGGGSYVYRAVLDGTEIRRYVLVEEDKEHNFWQDVLQQIKKADAGAEVTIDVGSYHTVPSYIIQALSGKDMTLVIQWFGHSDLKLTGEAVSELNQERNYSLEELEHWLALREEEAADGENGKPEENTDKKAPDKGQSGHLYGSQVVKAPGARTGDGYAPQAAAAVALLLLSGAAGLCLIWKKRKNGRRKQTGKE